MVREVIFITDLHPCRTHFLCEHGQQLGPCRDIWSGGNESLVRHEDLLQKFDIRLGRSGSLDKGLSVQGFLQLVEGVFARHVGAQRQRRHEGHQGKLGIRLGGVGGNQVHLLVRGLHGREQKDLLDVVLVGQKHGETINSQSKSSGGGQSMLQGGDEGIVQNHGFIVSGTSGLGLLQEELALYDRVVQFGISICQLSSSSKQFESFRQKVLGTMVLGQRTHDLGVLGNKGGVDNVVLQELSNESIQQTSRRVRW
mmetsp:Transcript_7171/g.14792  ORF Transcript_7171/g.14792 Transcript_7171/m.14792 type:complete len:254 (-) Transcript_7171:1317-2078(-)